MEEGCKRSCCFTAKNAGWELKKNILFHEKNFHKNF